MHVPRGPPRGAAVAAVGTGHLSGGDASRARLVPPFREASGPMKVVQRWLTTGEAVVLVPLWDCDKQVRNFK